MRGLYQKMFDQIHLSENRTWSIRSELVSEGSRIKMEEKTMKKQNFLCRPVGVLAAALAVCALTVTAFAYGERIVENVYTFVTGGSVEQGVDENGDAYMSGSVDTDSLAAPVEVKNGRAYLILNGDGTDITDGFSYTEPYLYDFTGEDGQRHVFVIGGETDAVGWAEFIWNADGMPSAGSSVFGTSEGRADAPWLDVAMKELGLPW